MQSNGICVDSYFSLFRSNDGSLNFSFYFKLIFALFVLKREVQNLYDEEVKKYCFRVVHGGMWKKKLGLNKRKRMQPMAKI